MTPTDPHPPAPPAPPAERRACAPAPRTQAAPAGAPQPPDAEAAGAGAGAARDDATTEDGTAVRTDAPAPAHAATQAAAATRAGATTPPHASAQTPAVAPAPAAASAPAAGQALSADPDAPVLPPLVRLTPPPPGVDPFVHAQAIAAQAGAGTLVWADDPAKLAFAVVLEPDAPLAQARRAFFVGMAALGDALAAACPPERRVAFRWPDAVFFDAARLGGVRLAAAPGPEDVAPDWLVFGVELIRARPGLAEAGAAPESTSLEEEGFDPAPEILASFARYLMLHADHWTQGNFVEVADAYLRRLIDKGDAARLSPEGDLLAAARTPRRLLADLQPAAWRDPARGGPRW